MKQQSGDAPCRHAPEPAFSCLQSPLKSFSTENHEIERGIASPVSDMLIAGLNLPNL
jgi:hypothetical protein